MVLFRVINAVWISINLWYVFDYGSLMCMTACVAIVISIDSGMVSVVFHLEVFVISLYQNMFTKNAKDFVALWKQCDPHCVTFIELLLAQTCFPSLERLR